MNSFLEKRIIRIRNTIKTSRNQTVLLNSRCANNSIIIQGYDSSFSLTGEAYMRDSSCLIEGKNNHVSMYNRGILTSKCSIRVIGNNNLVTIGEGCNILNSSIYIKGDNNRILIGNHVSSVFLSVLIERDDNCLGIGDGTTIHGRGNGGTEFALDEATSITIGKDCMISNEVSIRSSDSHSILNEKGERLNPAGNILIDDHVWIGMRSIILKNTLIHRNCIVGAGSICNKDYTSENCLIAGNPAKVLRENVNWSRDRL